MPKKKETKKQEGIRILFFLLVFLGFALYLGYVIQDTNFLEPVLDETTTSYISFNNKYTTDMLKIMNIEKMKDTKGYSSRNAKALEWIVEGEKDTPYEIVIYPISNKVEDAAIMVYLEENKKELITTSLGNLDTSLDGGKVLYQGKINGEKMVLRLWVSKKYKDKVGRNSFEIKIKPR